ncbi:MAG: class C sortase [Lactobacillales bacterium]|jgi:sortase A|nr:class C sortase [Lactobacillales bacterium]
MKRGKKKRKKKISFLMIFAFIMIFSGIGLLLYPIVGNYLANRERSEALSTYNQTMNQVSKKIVEHQLSLTHSYNQYIADKQAGILPKQAIAYENIVNQDDVMGTVDIPAIDIKKLPFYHGTSYKTLDKGLGHYQNSTIPIGGKNTRSVITGHSGVKNQVLFTDIRNLKVGDVFFINILNQRLAYEIDSFEEVLPSDVEKVKIQKGKDIVTLLTCTPPGINTYRLLVNGYRIPYKEATMKKVKKRNVWSYQNIVLVTLSLSFIIFVLLIVIYRHLLKKSKVTVPAVSLRAKKHIHQLLMVTRGLFIVLLVSMIAVLVTAIVGYFMMKQETDIGATEIGQGEELSAFNTNKILKASYDEKQIASVNIANYAEAKNNLQKNVNDWGIGKLYIPKVEINLPILAGLYNENLLSGVATYSSEQKLGKKNYVLLAHNIYQQDLLLHRIDKLNQGDSMYATDFHDIYVYRVTLNKVIQDTEIEYVENQMGEGTPIITLLRCEGNVGTIYRRIVQGELINTLPISHLSTQNRPLLKQMELTQKIQKVDGTIVSENPISLFCQFSMKLAASIISNPVQTIVPLFLMFVLPIIFLSLI